MKLTKLIIVLFGVLVFAGASFFSCDFISDGYGTLVIRLPGNAVSRTSGQPVESAVLNTFKYSIECTGPIKVTREARAGGTVRLPLAPGKWDIKVTVKDEFNFTLGYKEEKGVDIKFGATKTIPMQITADILAGSTIEMIPIPGGTFTMGRVTGQGVPDKEGPPRDVTLSSFRMSKYPITNRQYLRVMENTPWVSGTGGRFAAENISWYDAIVFCNKLSIIQGLSPAYRINGSTNPDNWGEVPTNNNEAWNAVQIVSGSNGYRLPTEAQWEYACRAGTNTLRYFDDENEELIDYAWFTTNTNNNYLSIPSVGLKKSNAWGLHDMYGYVWEWCWDRYGDYDVNDINNPMGAGSGTIRVQRGGGYRTPAPIIYSAYRKSDNPNSKDVEFGFRVVRPGN
ncbi:MAG: formylglycine-generating enzyme family protein [Treponema sp.]|nr:formylglycine-generating enzyme family protein [Treponema sp.]